MPIALRVWLSLSLAAVLLIGCGEAGKVIPGSAPGLPTLVEATANQTATALPTEASTPESVHSLPILLSLPADDSPPFEGYKSADYGAAVNDLTRWIDKWSVAKGIGTDAIGGVLQLVPLVGGGVGALVQSGSYYQEGRKTYLLIPIDKINGGLQAYPADGTVGEGTDRYPLFVTTDLDENLELVGTGTDQVYQAFKVDGNGKKVFTWYVNPKDNDKGNAGAKIAGEYVALVDFSKYDKAFFDPQSEADVPEVLQAPGLDDPNRAKWEDGYNAADIEKLKNYTGPTIDASIAVSIVYDWAQLNISLFNGWPVLSSYKFNWNWREMLTKTFVLRDPNGNKIPFSVTYSTPDSPIFDSQVGYGIPPLNLFMNVYYAWNEQTRTSKTDNFASIFLPNDKNYTGYNAMKNVLDGDGTANDRDVFSRARFLMGKYSN